MRILTFSVFKNVLLVLFFLSPLHIVAQQESEVEKLKVRDWVVTLSYEKNGKLIKRKDLIPLLQTVPEVQVHLSRANKYDVIRLISFLGAGAGAAMFLNSNEAGGTYTAGLILGFTSALLTFTSHFDYQNQMKKAVKSFNKSRGTTSFIHLSPSGFVYYF